MARAKSHKYIFVVGGVMSGVGKGIATASLGHILQSKGFKVNPIKIDPYLNVDAGTMNPTEHGEVFVLDSGLETDQDMGNYERFLELNLSDYDYITSGMVYKHVIDKERNLGYRGKTVEAMPHIVEEITRRIHEASRTHASDISIIEIGGTIGDYQNTLFIEAARVLKVQHPDDVLFVLVSYLPIPGTLGEMKTRPTQNAVRQLNGYGVHPDFVIARGKEPLDDKRKEKIAFSCAIKPDHVISAPDIKSVYDVPLNFEKGEIGKLVLKALKLRPKTDAPGLARWEKFVETSRNQKKEVKIAVVGKYFATGNFVLADSYVSVLEALKYSAYSLGAKPELTWISSQDIESGTYKLADLKKFDGILVPGGFGETGVEGKIATIRFARENKIPYFGLCYGMQLLTIEYARHVAKMKGAHTTEVNPKTQYPVVDVMDSQKDNLAKGKLGGTMRLGAYACHLKAGTIARDAYKQEIITERHRHRYEVNIHLRPKLEEAGLVFSGLSPDGTLAEIAELPRKVHPFFLGVQFHPEFKARPLSPHPLFTEFIKASLR
jgi:CTP synthase